MAYAALSSLMYTLQQLFKSNQSLVCRSSTQLQHVESIYQNLSAMQLFLDDTMTKDIETLKVIEKRIRDVVCKAEDKVDSSLRSIILADCTENREGACKFFEEELLKVEKDVDSLSKEVMQIDVNKHGSKSAELETTDPSSPGKSTIEENTTFGMEDEYNTILDRLTAQTDELTVIPIFGMGGIGKTTLARKVYDDSCIRSRFDKHAWVTISEEYNQRQMLLEVVSSISTGSNGEMSDDQLMEIVYRSLKGRRFLIVIDDIWSTEAWDQMQRIFPNDDNKSRILLTTRLKYVADYVGSPDYPPHSKSFLSLDDSWNLFTEKVFKKDPCPPLLVEIGKHIVQQCQGLPLSIVVVAGLLGKMDPTHDNWKKVEENLNSFFGTVSERCQSILSLSYNYLPQYLRACFLYVGGFPEDMVILVSKLIRLWIAEQFIKARSNKRLEMVAEEYLEELTDRSLILAGTRRANGRMRTCKIHDLLRKLCIREAIYDQRQVILSILEEKHDYRTRHSSGIIRTFISMQVDFPNRICSIVSQLKLLKVLDVLSVDYDFSCVIPQLVHLRYVAARIKEAVSLDKLRNLQTIILASTVEVTELKHPLDIWRTSEIRHLDIASPLYISNPFESEQLLFLNNLHTLFLRYSPFVPKIIRRTPNLKKLKIIGHRPFFLDWPAIFDSLHLLDKLETLGIKILDNIHPIIFSGDIFPPNLKELQLSETYIPCEVVNLLANLPNLEVFKGYRAFKGTDWRLNEDVVFRKLKYLRIVEADLHRWEAGSDNFPMLEQLILHGLRNLEEIPESIGEIMTLKFIKIEYCGSGVVNSAKKIQQEQESWGNYELKVQITPKIELLFRGKSCNEIRESAFGLSKRLAQTAQETFRDFEEAVEKDATKTAVSDGTVHPLTNYVINYVKFLFDYQSALKQLFQEFENGDSNSQLASVTMRIMQALQTNLDGKSKQYKDPSLTNLFLMNNIHYMVTSVRRSEAKDLLGDDWVQRHRRVVQQHANQYKRIAWAKILQCLSIQGLTSSGGSNSMGVDGQNSSGVSRALVKERLKTFNMQFEDLHQRQSQWTVPDTELRESLRLAVAEVLLPAYRSFIKRFGPMVESGKNPQKYIRYSAEDLERMLGEFFEGKTLNEPKR